MIVYNVTIKIDPQIEKEWLSWLKIEHVPRMMDTGLFVEYKLFHLLEHEENGITYVIQYFAPTIEHYQNIWMSSLRSFVKICLTNGASGSFHFVL